MDIKLPEELELLTTRDGSPTLAFRANGTSENMHNFHGAWSESMYVYGEALRRVQQLEPKNPVRVLSVGTGLGYNEIICTGFETQSDLKFEIDSHEAHPFLYAAFEDFLQSKNSSLQPVYSKILDFAAHEFAVPSSKLRERLKEAFSEKRLRLHGRLEASAGVPSSRLFHCLLYDPFSSKTNPDFWTPQGLESFLLNHCESPCVFSTYAATGVLKRVLKQAGFSIDVRPGFGGKRQCFLGYRSAKTADDTL